MSHHIMSCGHLNETAKFFRNTLRFFSGNYKDTIDYIISAYRCGSFDKIREFIKLRDRLTASQHFASISIEQKLLDLFTETQLHGQTVQVGIHSTEIESLRNSTLSSVYSTYWGNDGICLYCIIDDVLFGNRAR